MPRKLEKSAKRDKVDMSARVGKPVSFTTAKQINVLFVSNFHF